MSKTGKVLCWLGIHDYHYKRLVADGGLSASRHELRECRYCSETKCFSEHSCHQATYEERKALSS